MAEPSYDAVLLIDDEFEPPITIAEAEALKPIQKEFMTSYFANRDKIPLEDWLSMEMAKQLPSYDAKQIGEMSHEIIDFLLRNDCAKWIGGVGDKDDSCLIRNCIEESLEIMRPIWLVGHLYIASPKQL